jgi:hypothetical protein
MKLQFHAGAVKSQRLLHGTSRSSIRVRIMIINQHPRQSQQFRRGYDSLTPGAGTKKSQTNPTPLRSRNQTTAQSSLKSLSHHEDGLFDFLRNTVELARCGIASWMHFAAPVLKLVKHPCDRRLLLKLFLSSMLFFEFPHLGCPF